MNTTPPTTASTSPAASVATTPRAHSDSDPSPATIHWTEAGVEHSALWHSENGTPPPRRVVVADDTLSADSAYRLACEGTALLWRGDFQNARQLLQAMANRVDISLRKKYKVKPKRKTDVKADVTAPPAPPEPVEPPPPPPPDAAFNQYRQEQAQRARTLGMLLLPFDADYTVPLRRAPDVRVACSEAWGEGHTPSVASLRELLGLIGAHEWRKRGIEIPALDGRHIHPHYGVFAPLRAEYIGLVAGSPLPTRTLAFDIGTGTGVLAAVLARRGVERIIATDTDARALACARENLTRLGLAQRVEVVQADLFPKGRAALVVCNPPWLPARPSSALERAVYDPESRMLRGFLAGLADHLEPAGEGWLVLSDLAEHLGLRTREELLEAIAAGGLKVVGRSEARASHPRAADTSDLLHAARAAEVTSLWRLARD